MPAPVFALFVFNRETPGTHYFKAEFTTFPLRSAWKKNFASECEVETGTFWSPGDYTDHCTTATPSETHPDINIIMFVYWSVSSRIWSTSFPSRETRSETTASPGARLGSRSFLQQFPQESEVRREERRPGFRHTPLFYLSSMLRNHLISWTFTEAA